MRTKTVHSEVIWSLEPGSNVCASCSVFCTNPDHEKISDSLRHFGLSDKTKHLLLVKITDQNSPEALLARMKEVVDGQLAPLQALGTDKVGFSVKAIRKVTSPC